MRDESTYMEKHFVKRGAHRAFIIHYTYHRALPILSGMPFHTSLLIFILHIDNMNICVKHRGRTSGDVLKYGVGGCLCAQYHSQNIQASTRVFPLYTFSY
jgi:hypothetical protein